MGTPERLTGGPRDVQGDCCFACLYGRDKPCPLDSSVGLTASVQGKDKKAGDFIFFILQPIHSSRAYFSSTVWSGRKEGIAYYCCFLVKMRKQSLNSLTASSCWMENQKAWDASEDVEAGLSDWLVTVQTLTMKVRPMGQGGWGC